MRYTFTKLSLIVSCICLATNLNAQLENNSKLSLDVSAGGNRAFEKMTPGYSVPEYGSVLHLDAGLRYMLTSSFGFKLGIGSDKFHNADNSRQFESTYNQISLQAVLNLGRICNFDQWKPGISLLVHGGPGLGMLKGTTLENVELKDRTGLITLGFTPVIRLNDNISLTADVSGYGMMRQDRTFDFKSKVTTRGFDGYFGTMSLGFMVSLGKKGKDNIDWRVENQPSNSEGAQIDSLEKNLGEMRTKLETNNSEIVEIKKELDELKKGLKQISEEGLYYTVQLGFFKESIPPSNWKGLKPLIVIKGKDGSIKYNVGILLSIEEALNVLEEAKEKGFSDAFATAYYKGNRITISEAATLLKEKGDSVLRSKN